MTEFISKNGNFLKEYALSNNIIGWDSSLSKICKKEGIEYKKVQNIKPTRHLVCTNIFRIYIYTPMSKVYTIFS